MARSSHRQQAGAIIRLTQKVTVSYGGEPVSHTRDVTSLQSTIIRLMEAEEEINKQIDELVDLKIDIGKLIGQVRNESYRMILEKRYLCFLPWDQIAADMNYSRRWTLTKHERAVEVVDRLMRERNM